MRGRQTGPATHYGGAVTSSLLTDLYELTMLRAAREAGVADRRCVFEVFARSLPEGRRYGALAGTGRVLEAIADFRFDDSDLRYLRSTGVLDEDTLDHLAQYRFTGDVHGYAEGELYFPNSPVLRVEGTFGNAVLLETVILSIINHDSGVASVGSRMVTAARGRPCIEMGGRRVHEDAAIHAARGAYVVGFDSTSNLAAGAHYRIPVAGTAAHAFTLLFDTEEEAFRAQLASQGTDTALLVDTYDVEQAVRTAVELAGPELGAVRLDSGDLEEQAGSLRKLLDSLGATGTRITATGDLDEYRVEELASVGSRMVTAARGRPCIEMGGRRVHEDAAIHAARGAYVVGFDSTSNLAAGAHYRIPVAGTAAHAFTLLFDTEEEAFRAQLASQGTDTALLVDTYDVEQAVRTAVELAGPELGAVRLDSGDLEEQAGSLRKLLDSLGATGTRITATGDLDEYRVEELADAPVDGYGIGTKLVTGGGHPAPGFVYKLVEREGSDGQMHPVGKKSRSKATLGAGKHAYRMLVGGRAHAELVLPGEAEVAEFERELHAELNTAGASADWGRTELRPLQVPLILGGEPVESLSQPELVQQARRRHQESLTELGLSPDDGPDGPVAIPTVTDGTEAARVLR